MKIDTERIKSKLKREKADRGDRKRSVFDQVKDEKEKQGKIKTVYYIIFIAILGITILVNVLNYKSQKEEVVPTINEANIETKKMNIAEGDYEVKVSPAETVNGREYMNVTVSDYTTVWPKEKVDAVIGTNNQIRTKMYIVTFKNKERFFLNLFTPSQLQIIRMSCAGESEFSDAEVDAYKSLAAYYFTYQKAKKLGREDKENYNINIEGQSNNENIFDKIRNKFNLNTKPSEAEVQQEMQQIQTQQSPITTSPITIERPTTNGIQVQGVSLDDHITISY